MQSKKSKKPEEIKKTPLYAESECDRTESKVDKTVGVAFADMGGAVSAGCENASESKKSITHSAKKSKDKEKVLCKISRCSGKLCCADCDVYIRNKCDNRCLNSPEKCRLTFVKEGAAK